MITAKFSEIFMEIKSEDDVEIQIRPYVQKEIKSEDDVEIQLHPYVQQDISCNVICLNIDIYDSNVEYWRIVLPTELVGLCLYHFKRLRFSQIYKLVDFKPLPSHDFVIKLCDIDLSTKDEDDEQVTNNVTTYCLDVISNAKGVDISIKPKHYQYLDSHVFVSDTLLDWCFKIGFDEWVCVLDDVIENSKLSYDTNLGDYEESFYKTYFRKRKPQKLEKTRKKNGAD